MSEETEDHSDADADADADADTDADADADANEMIDQLAIASEATTSILKDNNFSTALREGLQSSHPTPFLLQLAKFFRAQSALLVRQAKALEEAAVAASFSSQQQQQAVVPVSGDLEDIGNVLFRKNISNWAGKTYSLMEESHDKLDSIEEVLVPIYRASKKNKLVQEPAMKKGLSVYGLFFKEHYQSIFLPPDLLYYEQQVCQFKGVAALWKAMDQEEKQAYRKKFEAVKEKSAEEERQRDRAKKRRLDEMKDEE